MQAERARTETYLRNRGYYNFNREYIYYEVDSSLRTHQVVITIGVKKFILPSEEGYYLMVPHRKYRIEEVYIYPGFDPKRAIADNKAYIDGLTSFKYKEFEFRHEDKLKSDPGVISQSVFIMPGEEYDAEKVNSSRTGSDSERSTVVSSSIRSKAVSLNTPAASTMSSKPGSRTTVPVASRISAGPTIRWPARSASLS